MDVRRMVAGWLDGPTPKAWGSEFVRLNTVDDEIKALFGRVPARGGQRTYRMPSVRAVMGDPAIHRAVALIASTTGSLTMQGYRNGAVMTDTPRILSRPDPYQTPQDFYSGTAANMAKYGEFIWWIASRDNDGIPSALVNVPLGEVKVTGTANRLNPYYEWGSITGYRYSTATPDGKFVHYKYPLGEPLDLRGSGPLQICRAATSVTVEAAAWAAQFFAEGGIPSIVIKHAGILDGTQDVNGMSEADRLRSQFVDRPHNVPRVIDQNIESIDFKDVNQQGAQMLEARQYQNGDAARMFGMPGSLLEYQVPGSSLTYQNLEGEFTKFVRGCLSPLYLEPIEQAMSDLLTRSTVARFNVKGFLRADIKTRFGVHQIAIQTGIYDAAFARQEEGIDPGDVEYAPVPAAPPAAIPTTIPRIAQQTFSTDTMRDIRCARCGRLVMRAAGPAEGWCRHCKEAVAVA